MKLSLVLPTYKKEREVLEQLERLYGYLTRVNPDFELIFVIDGYVDTTRDTLINYIREHSLDKVRVIGYDKNMGKGYAVRHGMKYAIGDIVGFMDSDTDIMVRSLGFALISIAKPYVEAVIPSKYHDESNVELSNLRKIISRGLFSLNKSLLRIPSNVTDIGCGLKLFKRDTINTILPSLSVDGFAIDSEIINELGRSRSEVMVTPLFLNKNRSDSTSVNIRSVFRMSVDILNIFLKNIVFYYQKFALSILGKSIS